MSIEKDTNNIGDMYKKMVIKKIEEANKEPQEVQTLDEGILDRTGARLAGVGARVSTGLQNVKGAFGRGSGTMKSAGKAQDTAKAAYIANTFKKEMSKLYGNTWETLPQFKALSSELNKLTGINNKPVQPVTPVATPPAIPTQTVNNPVV